MSACVEGIVGGICTCEYESVHKSIIPQMHRVPFPHIVTLQ